MKLNVKTPQVKSYTHEGAPATPPPNAAVALRRAVMACLLWEDSFYESGMDITKRIQTLVPLVPPEVVHRFAVKARTDMKLRHAPLLLAREMARATPAHRRMVGQTLAHVIQRADELTEFLAIYWKTNDGKRTLSAQVKKGLAAAFQKFNEYDFAKYDRDSDVKLRDALFLSHAKPADAPGRLYTKAERKAGRHPKSAGEKLFERIVNGTLETPDTWEVELSDMTGTEGMNDAQKLAHKRDKWVRLLNDNRLGALALLRNLRNMQQANVPIELIENAIKVMKVERVLPHRFIAAARFAPNLESLLEAKMFEAVKELPKLPGRTLWLIDVSGSMNDPLSQKSDMRRIDAACGLAMIGRELCERVAVCTFSSQLVEVPDRRGFALRDAIDKSQPHGATYLGQAISAINQKAAYDRIVVVTDEQSADRVPAPRPGAKGYMINVAAYKNGVGYGDWNKLDGFSEAVVRYIAEFESME